MRSSNRLSAAILICGCAILLFATPIQAVNCEKNPNHKNCGGNGGNPGGGTSHPIDLTFRDTGGLGDDGSDRFRSDVSGTGTIMYTDGEPGVSTRIRDDGLLLINITSTDRAVVLDFADLALPPECDAACKKNFTVASTDNFPPAAAAKLQVFDNDTSRQHRVDQFLGMGIGETLRGEMQLGFGGAGKSTRFSVRFQALDGTLDTEVVNKTSFLEITRTTQNSWFIEAVNPDDQALLISKVKKKGKFVVEDEGTYRMPFGLTVNCQSTCPDRSGE